MSRDICQLCRGIRHCQPDEGKSQLRAYLLVCWNPPIKYQPGYVRPDIRLRLSEHKCTQANLGAQ
jgi:hypothetical protein